MSTRKKANNIKNVVFMNYKRQNTLAEISEHASLIQKLFRKEKLDGLITVNALFPAANGKPAQWKALTHTKNISDEDLKIYNEQFDTDYFGKGFIELPEKFLAHQVVIIKNGKEGGCSSNGANDCLYECLKKLVNNFEYIFSTSHHLKTWCELKKYDKISIDKIPQIEEKLKNYKINVYEYNQYISSKEAKYTISLLLNYEHYTIYESKLNKKKGIAFEEKEPIIYKYNSENPKKVKIYNEKGFATISYNQLAEMLHYPITCKYIPIKTNGKSMKETYSNFIMEADILKTKTNGKYNLYKCGTYVKASINRFYELNKTLIADEIDSIEGEWIRKSSTCALMWTEKEYEGPGHEYDVNSMYPAIISYQKFSFPIKKGIFKKITQEEFDNMRYFEYGIYRCKISKFNYKLVKENTYNYYTHYCLTRMKELDCKIKIIIDDQPNLLSYAKSTMRINENVAFKKFVDEMYELKKNDNVNKKIFKNPLTFIWGALCQKVKWKKIFYDNDQFDVENRRILKIVPLEDDLNAETILVTTLDNENYYNTSFARLGPFLLLRAKYMISRIIEPHLKHIVRVQTDGFISTKKT
jgi:hypothetical protein